MNQRIVFLAIALAAAACGKKNEEKALAPAVFGKVVAPPGELGKLKVGMPIAEAKKVAPNLIPKDDDYDTFPGGWKDVRFGVDLTDDKQAIERLNVSLPKAAREMMITAWGPGQAATCTTRPCVYWLDPATGVRAVMKDGFSDDVDVEFTDYLPIEKLLGGKPGALAFETGPSALGTSLDELRTAYKPILIEQAENKEKNDSKMEWFELPPTAYEGYWTRVNLTLDKANKVASLRFSVPYSDYPAAKDTILAAFETAWGKGIAVVDTIGRAQTVWLDPAAGRRATLDASFEGTLNIEVEPYMALDKLLGEGPDKLGFETTPLLGMTWPEIEKAYPAYVETETDEEAIANRKKIENFMGEKLDELGAAKGGATFKMPGTEWGEFTLVHLRYDGAGKVRQFAFDIPWGLHPDSKAPILAALEKKYGGKKEVTEYGRTSYELRAKAPPVKVESSEITKHWQVEVGEDP